MSNIGSSGAGQIGQRGIDLGSLTLGGRLMQFPGGILPAQHLVKLP
jgi:8-hydroxy-5-deazaflavin:NADPH oxidoreductase